MTGQEKCWDRFVELESCEGELDIEHPSPSKKMDDISEELPDLVWYANQMEIQ